MKMTDTIDGSKLYYYFSFLNSDEYKVLQDYLMQPKFVYRSCSKLLSTLAVRAIEGTWKSTTYGDLVEVIAHRKSKNLVATITQEMSYAKKLLLEFMVVNDELLDQKSMPIKVVKALFERGATKYIKFESKEEELQLRSLKSEQDFAANIELESIHYQLRRASNRQSKQVKWDRVLDAIVLQEVFLKIKYACAALNQDLTISSSHRLPPMGSILDQISRKQAKMPTVIVAYYHAYSLLKNRDEMFHVERLKRLLFGSRGRSNDDPKESHSQYEFDPEERMALINLLENHCVRMVNRGLPGAYKELCGHYDSRVDERSIMDMDDKLSPSRYKNIVVAYAENQEIDKAKRFASEYRPKLFPSTYSSDYHTFCEGVFAYHGGEIEVAKSKMESLTHRPTETFLGLDARCILAKILSDQGEWDELQVLLDALRVLIIRKKNLEKENGLGDRLKGYSTFQRLVHQYSMMHNCKVEKVESRREKLVAALERKEMRVNMDWLKRKLGLIEQLEKVASRDPQNA